MTMLASWIGKDTHGVSSAYIVSDSRYSWINGMKYDGGAKTFASQTFPDIFGFVGDVLFPINALSQIVKMIDNGVFFSQNDSCSEKNKKVFDKLSNDFHNYPKGIMKQSFSILHISREYGNNEEKYRYLNFHCFLLSWNASNSKKKWTRKEIFPDEKSGFVLVEGSGAQSFRKRYEQKYKEGKNKQTSRNIFHCFISTLCSIEDETVGGPPQLVGIFRKPCSAAIEFGIVYRNCRFFSGTKVPKAFNLSSINWRNANFEICNPKTGKVIDGASRQPDLLRDF